RRACDGACGRAAPDGRGRRPLRAAGIRATAGQCPRRPHRFAFRHLPACGAGQPRLAGDPPRHRHPGGSRLPHPPLPALRPRRRAGVGEDGPPDHPCAAEGREVGAALPALQVPLDGRRRGAPAAGFPRALPALRGVELQASARGRPTDHATRPLPAPGEPRRAAAALERAERRYEPLRAARHRPGGGRELRRLCAHAPAREAGADRVLAGERAELDRLPRTGPHGPAVRGTALAAGGSPHPPPDAARRPAAARGAVMQTRWRPRRRTRRPIAWGRTAVCLYAALIPLQPVLAMPDGTHLRIAAADAAAPLVVLAAIAAPRRRLSAGLSLVAIGIPLLALFSTLVAATDRSLSWYAMGKTAGLAYLVVVALAAARALEHGAEPAVLRALASGGIWSAVVGLAGYAAWLAGMPNQLVAAGRLCSTMPGDPNIYCSLLAVALLITALDAELTIAGRLVRVGVLAVAL